MKEACLRWFKKALCTAEPVSKNSGVSFPKSQAYKPKVGVAELRLGKREGLQARAFLGGALNRSTLDTHTMEFHKPHVPEIFCAHPLPEFWLLMRIKV